MCHGTNGSSPIKIQSPFDRNFDPSLIEIAIPYIRLPMGPWSGIGAFTIHKIQSFSLKAKIILIHLTCNIGGKGYGWNKDHLVG